MCSIMQFRPGAVIFCAAGSSAPGSAWAALSGPKANFADSADAASAFPEADIGAICGIFSLRWVGDGPFRPLVEGSER